jgi:hypothetical protein
MFETASGSLSEESASPAKTSGHFHSAHAKLSSSPTLNALKLHENSSISSLRRISPRTHSVDPLDQITSKTNSSPIRSEAITSAPKRFQKSFHLRNALKSMEANEFSVASIKQSPFQIEVDQNSDKWNSTSISLKEKGNAPNSFSPPPQLHSLPTLQGQSLAESVRETPNHALHPLILGYNQNRREVDREDSSPLPDSRRDSLNITRTEIGAHKRPITPRLANGRRYITNDRKGENLSPVAGQHPLVYGTGLSFPVQNNENISKNEEMPAMPLPPFPICKNEDKTENSALGAEQNDSLSQYSRLHLSKDSPDVSTRLHTLNNPIKNAVEEIAEKIQSVVISGEIVQSPVTSDRNMSFIEIEDSVSLRRSSKMYPSPNFKTRSSTCDASLLRNPEYSLANKDNLEEIGNFNRNNSTFSESKTEKNRVRGNVANATKPRYSPLQATVACLDGNRALFRDVRNNMSSKYEKVCGESAGLVDQSRDAHETIPQATSKQPELSIIEARSGDLLNKDDETVVTCVGKELISSSVIAQRECIPPGGGNSICSKEGRALRLRTVRSNSPGLLRGAPDFNSFLNKQTSISTSTLRIEETRGSPQSLRSASLDVEPRLKDEGRGETHSESKNGSVGCTEPLQHMLTVPRVNKYTPRRQAATSSKLDQRKVTEKNEQISRDSNTSTASTMPREATSYLSYSYGSAKRLSNRLTRAERFNALKVTREIQVRVNHDETSVVSQTGGGEWTSKPHEKVHPIFGYTTKTIEIKTDDELIEDKESSAIEMRPEQNPKRVTDALRKRADKLAAASPARGRKKMLLSCDNSDSSSYIQNQNDGHIENKVWSEAGKGSQSLRERSNHLDIKTSIGKRVGNSPDQTFNRKKLFGSISSVEANSIPQVNLSPTITNPDTSPYVYETTFSEVSANPMYFHSSNHISQRVQAMQSPLLAVNYCTQDKTHGHSYSNERMTKDPLNLSTSEQVCNISSFIPTEISRIDGIASPEEARPGKDFQLEKTKNEKSQYSPHASNEGISTKLNIYTESFNRQIQSFGPNLNSNAECILENITPTSKVSNDLIEEDDDDIFFGLEEEIFQPIALPDKMGKRQAKVISTNSAIPSSNNVPTQKIMNEEKVSTEENFQNSTISPVVLRQEVKPGISIIKSDHSSSISTVSDVTSSILAVNYRKLSRFRPNPEDTIAEETAEDDRHISDPKTPSQEVRYEDEATADESIVLGEFDTVVLSHEDSVQDPKPVHSIFLNLGCALVNTLQSSFQNACHVAGK